MTDNDTRPATDDVTWDGGNAFQQRNIQIVELGRLLGERNKTIDDQRQQIAAQARRIEETEAHCRAHQKDADDFRKRAFAAESERQLQKGSHEKAWAERDMALRTVADLQRDLSAATTDERQLRCAYDACTRDNNQLEQDNTRLRGIIGDLEQQLAAQPKATPLEPCEWMVHGNGDVLFFSEEKKARAEAQKLTTLTHDVSLHRSQFVAVCRGRHVWSDMVSP